MERRLDWFAMRLSREEREQIELLAAREGRSASAAVRAAIQRAIQESERTKQERALVSISRS